ncbi:MAG: CBS domain-containing protein [Halomonadaceae bacterium]|nr:MAG: CBS domain-containing protein [Halomonadaceae bacterium]
MKVRDVMHSSAETVRPDTTISDAAALMARKDLGFLLVEDNDRLQGTVTDRDIVLRCISQCKDPANTTVADILTRKVLYCTEDQEIEELARNMRDLQIRRMPVVNQDKRLVGVVGIKDMAGHVDEKLIGEVMCGVTNDQQSAA